MEKPIIANRICRVVTMRPPAQIFQAIVRGVVVQMAANGSRRAGDAKGQEDCMVDAKLPPPDQHVEVTAEGNVGLERQSRRATNAAVIARVRRHARYGAPLFAAYDVGPFDSGHGVSSASRT